ncbi:MAG: DUF3306 domain-containing protein [Alphaproteobacteria bacterium]|nr:DUF3306 domain-containing protein [Alphaproteobacteria bacterium]
MVKMATDRSDPENSLLSRWAKRKEAVREAEEVEAAVAEPAEEAEPETEEEAMALLEERDPELAEQISTMDLDKLSYDDDFTVFMKTKVPDIIRRKALSKLWLSHPLLANLDGLNEYDEDYTQAADAAETVRKIFEAARLRKEEAAKKKAREALASNSSEPAPEEEAETAEADTDDLVEDDDGDLEA